MRGGRVRRQRCGVHRTPHPDVQPSLAQDYQPAQKWLKDRAAKGGKNARAGRILTPEDQLHYRRMIVALERTAEIMTQIDQVIARHGGWPGAFKGMTD